MTGLQFPHHLVAETVKAALAEDLGLAGDITTNALIPADAFCEATLGLREDGRIAGLPLAVAAFRALDPGMEVEVRVEEGGHGPRRNHDCVALRQDAGDPFGGAGGAQLHAAAVRHRDAHQQVRGLGEGDDRQDPRHTQDDTRPRAFEKYAVQAGGGQITASTSPTGC